MVKQEITQTETHGPGQSALTIRNLDRSSGSLHQLV